MHSEPNLFCFTYAGGTSSFFDLIEKDLCGIDLVKLDYAGHGMRHREAVYHDFDELADDLYQKLKQEYSGDKYGLFGYSMGSITAVEVLRRILQDGMTAPSRVFLAAHEPHTKSELLNFSPDELDEWVKTRTIQFGAVPPKLLNNKTFWRMYLPLFRHDYTLIGKYRFDMLDLKTDLPVTVFYSESDTPLQEMRLWENYFRGEVEYCEFEGSHFFIQEHHREIGKVITDRLGVSI